jgi:phage/plasmid-like protein (TIGR03299 family)
MSHELEFINGLASFVGRKPGWHRLGTVIKDLDYAQAMELAHLSNWNVRAENLTALIGDVEENAPVREHDAVFAEDHKAVVRDNPGTGSIDLLGIVGGKYTTVQNEQAFAIAEYLTDLGATIETAGSIRNGRQVFMSLQLDGGFVIDPDGGNDRVQGFLLLRTSHDGSVKIEAGATWVRVVCANTFDFALGGNFQSAYKIKHTAKAGDRLASAQAALLNANKYGERLAEFAQRLYQIPMSTKEFVEVATDIYPKPETKRGTTVWRNQIDLLGDLFAGGGDVEFTLDNVRGTAWAGFNALTERLDWHRQVRGKNKSQSLAVGQAGFNSAISAEKVKIFNRINDWADEKVAA